MIDGYIVHSSSMRHFLMQYLDFVSYMPFIRYHGVSIGGSSCLIPFYQCTQGLLSPSPAFLVLKNNLLGCSLCIPLFQLLLPLLYVSRVSDPLEAILIIQALQKRGRPGINPCVAGVAWVKSGVLHIFVQGITKSTT